MHGLTDLKICMHFVYPSPKKTLFGETASSNLFPTDEDKVRLITYT